MHAQQEFRTETISLLACYPDPHRDPAGTEIRGEEQIGQAETAFLR
jgi:hypothetical protein